MAMVILATDRREPADPKLLRDIYIDESSQTKNRYLLMGGIIIPTLAVQSASEKIAEMRVPELPHGEMKWGKVSRGKLPAYRRVVDAFFDAPEFNGAHFHSLIVDTSMADHARFNSGSKEIGFNKEIFQLANKCARLYPGVLFHLYPDYRDTNQRPDDLRDILNHYRHKHRDGREWPFRRSQFRDSSKTPLLQLVDILLGSIGFGKNEHHKKPDASPHKLELARHIMRRAGVRDISRDTARTGKFTIWHRQFR